MNRYNQRYEKSFMNKSKPAAILIEQTPGGASGDRSNKLKNTFIAKELYKFGYKSLEIENYSLKNLTKGTLEIIL